MEKAGHFLRGHNRTLPLSRTHCMSPAAYAKLEELLVKADALIESEILASNADREVAALLGKMLEIVSTEIAMANTTRATNPGPAGPENDLPTGM